MLYLRVISANGTFHWIIWHFTHVNVSTNINIALVV